MMGMDADTASHMTQAVSTGAVTPVPFESKHMHGMPILERAHLTTGERLYWESYNTTTFFTTELGSRGALHLHITTFIACLIIVYPACLVLNSARSKWYLASLTANLTLLIISFISICTFMRSFPMDENWYPNNIYVSTWVVLLVSFMSHYVATGINKLNQHMYSNQYALVSDVPMHDIGSASPGSNATIVGLPTEEYDDYSYPKSSRFLAKIEQSTILRRSVLKLGSVSRVVSELANVPIFFLMGVTLFIGLAVGNLLGKNQRIFNLLAHWIKGGVFLILGLVSLARYCGMGETYGWSWNRKIYSGIEGKASRFLPKGTITVEGIESFLVFFYGTTNIFLEHLAGSGGAWSAKDLQHVSIAFIYIGTGLSGLLTEIKLNTWRFERSLYPDGSNTKEECIAGTPGYSPNPFPALTIFWTGILMSQHAQASEASTKIHAQWGYLLSYGSFFRIITFLILYFEPPKDFRPSKPLTELITSFCLICGGVIFMESTDQVIEAIEYRGFTPLFTCNLSVGISSLLMAWLMMLFLWRDWLLSYRKEHETIDQV
ncbi:Tvs1p KNAG_0I02910 [Huiozyma naganishii CBS 8797]|uniref:Protein YTP1-like C-terminal domain-containing protein n=1 Tax=Huiozyma naganishii (strain ATCC MYA-139 / BCRC 22969 / CBS 8797 / KCTC 17520 / NBRC 10181 / NCYC 3082 / Yp74L-3) TaxID=1071383 RepID=J7RB24_HUIN7|nr:hypothetical protein KNAG_0I02910 [Kazachstania naganishii CBS 8797]CCK72075.1 hypothetical protein KNAG_0I02910 [Kazachstania naganishii CBS 8797]